MILMRVCSFNCPAGNKDSQAFPTEVWPVSFIRAVSIIFETLMRSTPKDWIMSTITRSLLGSFPGPNVRLDAFLSGTLIIGEDGARFIKNRGLERMIGVASAAWDDRLIKFLRFITIKYDFFSESSKTLCLCAAIR